MGRAYISFAIGVAAIGYALFMHSEGRPSGVVAIAALAGLVSIGTGTVRWRGAR